MNPKILRIYLLEIRTQCILAHHAIDDMTRLASNAYMGIDAPQFWYCLQAFLSAAANLSKLLWPDLQLKKGREARDARGRELRELLGIDEQSALQARALRNDIEHLDERLDNWVQSQGSGEQLEPHFRVIGPGAPSVMDLASHQCFLYFDAEKYNVIFKGNKCEILPISWEIHSHLMPMVDELLNMPSMASSDLTEGFVDSAADWPLPKMSENESSS